MYSSFMLSMVATTVEMTACFICARQLWVMRTATKDRARRILALGSLLSGLLALFVVLANLFAPDLGSKPAMLQPWVGLIYLSMHILMTLYPISVVQPEWLTVKRFYFLFLPTLIFALVFLFFVGRWTPLPTPASVWEHASSADVIVRLASLFIMLPYCAILVMMPYNPAQSSASRRWIILYTLGLTVICGLHIVITLTYSFPLIVILSVVATNFYVFSTEYELEERFDAPAGNKDGLAPLSGTKVEEPIGELDIWGRICLFMDKEQVWRDPNLTLGNLAQSCATNITYLNRVIRENTGNGFKDLVKTKRIECVAKQLEENPDLDLQNAFFNAGYRSRTTAWRNFKDIMGTSPAEFKQGLQ